MDDSQLRDGAVDYDEAEHSYTIPVDAAESASMAVVELVDALEDVETEEMEQLFDSFDPEALDALYESIASGGVDGEFEFRYHGYEVTIATDGTVSARPIAGEEVESHGT